VSRYWAVNASPLIVLAKIGRVDLLAALCDVLVIPAGTTEEVLRGDEQDPAARWIRDEGHRFIVQDAPSTPEVSAWDLGQGETAVLSWVHQHPGYEALLDGPCRPQLRSRTGHSCAWYAGHSSPGEKGWPH
jgi:hypothetical protein